MSRTVICYDMDMYFAAVTIRDNPTLKDKPLVIGSLPGERGVVSTASYEARKYGIHSGMSSYEAYRKCPHAIFMHPNMSAIVETTEIIKNIVSDYSKYSAKIASEENKPDGLGKIMSKKELLDIIINRPARILQGVGKQVEQHLAEKNIKTVKDIQMKTVEYMKENFGLNGIFLYYMAWGIDDREVISSYEEEGIGNSNTLPVNINGLINNKKVSYSLFEKLERFNQFIK